MMTRRQFLTVSTVLFAAAMSRSAAAAPYPVRSIRLIAGHPPGGQSDVLARIIAPKLGEMLGRSVTVENRSGAAGSIAATLVAKAAPMVTRF
jgi:tripartite-type tricarboxylate transporter receptor subunit TctC